MFSTVSSRLARICTSTWTLGVVIAAVTWPLEGVAEAGGGQDGSWQTALYMAIHDGLHFGSDVVWVYGPLGFLTVPRLAYPGLAALSVAYVAIVQLGLALSVLWALRRSLALALAFPAALLITALFPITGSADRFSAQVLTIVFIWCVAMMRGSADGEMRRAPEGEMRGATVFPIAAGIVSGIEVLVRLNTGLTTLLLCAITVAVAFPGHRLRAVTTFAIAFAASLLALWGATGQAFDDIPRYVARSFELISGYSQRLQDENGQHRWEYLAAPLIVILLAGTAVWATRGWHRVARGGTYVITAILLFSAFKQGFVRHEDGHAPFFFATALGAGVALGWPRLPRRFPLFGLAPLGALLAVYLAVIRPPTDTILRPTHSLSAAEQTIQLVSSPSRTIEKSRDKFRQDEEFDARALALARGKTVHIWPEESGLAWAFPEIRWHPLPVFQGNLTYTEELDHLNAEALSSASGPLLVLRNRVQHPVEAPAATMALFCHYRQVRATEAWQVLARVPNRCGHSRLIRSARADTDESVTVPSPSGRAEMVIARIRVGAPLGDRLMNFLYKGPSWELKSDTEKFKWAPGNGSGPLMVRVPDALDYPRPYRLAARFRTIELNVGRPGPRLAEGEKNALTLLLGGIRRPTVINFYAVPVTAPATAGSR
jgi:hypothetical protein